MTHWVYIWSKTSVAKIESIWPGCWDHFSSPSHLRDQGLFFRCCPFGRYSASAGPLSPTSSPHSITLHRKDRFCLEFLSQCLWCHSGNWSTEGGPDTAGEDAETPCSAIWLSSFDRLPHFAAITYFQSLCVVIIILSRVFSYNQWEKNGGMCLLLFLARTGSWRGFLSFNEPERGNADLYGHKEEMVRWPGHKEGGEIEGQRHNFNTWAWTRQGGC